MTKLLHPFLNHPVTTEKLTSDQNALVDDLYNWIKDQPTYPNLSREHAHQFLHACYWNTLKAKKALQNYCEIRANSPLIFANRDSMSDSVQNVFNMTQMVSVPKTTPEGYHLLFYRLTDTDPAKMNFSDAVRAFCMFNDLRISEDGLTEGYIVVFDMKGLKLGHLAKIQLGSLRAFMSYIQEAHPVRLKKVLVIHAASIINQIMMILRPLIKSDLLSLLQFTPNGPLELFSEDIIPEDYGGKLKSMAEYYKVERKLLESKYRDWLIDSEDLKEIRPKKGKDTKSVQPITNSFSQLEID
ncbi:retinaldehyde-binding protein 1-like [Bradysia coprophila]|uniref:retinaldehyde-binding protein 1-like n=1 Tax=Bradysia coprophila TaxID=38358 RepID=UPI00187DC884|nr:retinaldehyde-binding protein 1-like [Bradysia coprophila]XP_037039601.1 retinaldehyde-binding protein 1-like [Bradysia coprophila]XP_037039602.1 retinaldehyde-binding protein 1-like [Bradysia coprophila]